MQRHRTPDHRRARTWRLLLALLGSVTAFCTHADDRPDEASYTRAQQRVDIGGRSLNLVCMGSAPDKGTPTVIFESGLSDWSFSWALVQPRVGTIARACSYDRAGLGYSDPNARAGSSANIVDDLHRLLRQARIAPPYVLVGHSLGGLTMRLYADRFRSEIVGMVLVDALHEDSLTRLDIGSSGGETRRLAAEVAGWRWCTRSGARTSRTARWQARCIEPADPRFSPALNAARRAVAQRPSYQAAQLSEALNYLDGNSFAPVRTARRFYGALPLTVLSSERTIASAGPQWLQMHRELATLSSLGQQQTVSDAGHYIQLDQPDVVVSAIADILHQVQQTSANRASPP